jgi:hypothetical protein
MKFFDRQVMGLVVEHNDDLITVPLFHNNINMDLLDICQESLADDF